MLELRQLLVGCAGPCVLVFLAAAAHGQTADNAAAPAPARQDQGADLPGLDQFLPLEAPAAEPGSPLATLHALGEDIADVRSPPLLIAPSLSLSEVLTDNVGHSATDEEADLISQLTGSISIAADLPRLQGAAYYSATVVQAVNDTSQNRVTQNALANGQLIISPDFLTVDASARVEERGRQGLAPGNQALQTESETTQLYGATVSPYLHASLGAIAYAELRYSLDQTWYARNRQVIVTPTGVLPGLDDTTRQTASAQLSLPGVISDRLSTTLAADLTTLQSGEGLGRLTRKSASLTNEIAVTRTVSALGAIGYEQLKHPLFDQLSGEGMTWNAGARWRPNPDYSVLVTYGRRNLDDSFSAEAEYAPSENTRFVASYITSISSAQQGDPFNSGSLGSLSGLANPGSPIATLPDLGPLYSDIVRQRIFRAAVTTELLGNEVSLIGFHTERDSLTGLAPSQASTGVNLGATRRITDILTGFVYLNYSVQDFDDADAFDGALGVNYEFIPTWSAAVRYDYVRRDARTSALSYDVNALTLTVRKLF